MYERSVETPVIYIIVSLSRVSIDCRWKPHQAEQVIERSISLRLQLSIIDIIKIKWSKITACDASLNRNKSIVPTAIKLLIQQIYFVNLVYRFHHKMIRTEKIL